MDSCVWNTLQYQEYMYFLVCLVCWQLHYHTQLTKPQNMYSMCTAQIFPPKKDVFTGGKMQQNQKIQMIPKTKTKTKPLCHMSWYTPHWPEKKKSIPTFIEPELRVINERLATKCETQRLCHSCFLRGFFLDERTFSAGLSSASRHLHRLKPKSNFTRFTLDSETFRVETQDTVNSLWCYNKQRDESLTIQTRKDMWFDWQCGNVAATFWAKLRLVNISPWRAENRSLQCSGGLPKKRSLFWEYKM